MAGASVAVTYLDDEPEGFRMTTAAYRTVREYAVPRASLRDFRELPGANTAGLYLLWGEHPDAEWMRQAYVGKTLSLGDLRDPLPLSESAEEDIDFLRAALVHAGRNVPRGL